MCTLVTNKKRKLEKKKKEKGDWPIIISKMTRKGLKILTKFIAGLIGFHTLKYT